MATKPDNVFAPPKSVVMDQASPSDLVKASRGSRLVAKIIDGLLLGVAFAPGWLWVSTQFRSMNPQYARMWTFVSASHTWFFGGLLLGIAVALINAYLVQQNGQTIGKKALDIKIVRADGARVTLARVFFLRYLLNTVFSMVPFFGGLYALIDILFIFGEPRRCVHDYLADTIVIKA